MYHKRDESFQVGQEGWWKLSEGKSESRGGKTKARGHTYVGTFVTLSLSHTFNRHKEGSDTCESLPSLSRSTKTHRSRGSRWE